MLLNILVYATISAALGCEDSAHSRYAFFGWITKQGLETLGILSVGRIF
jgi:hypothetical protein